MPSFFTANAYFPRSSGRGTTGRRRRTRLQPSPTDNSGTTCPCQSTSPAVSPTETSARRRKRSQMWARDGTIGSGSLSPQSPRHRPGSGSETISIAGGHAANGSSSGDHLHHRTQQYVYCAESPTATSTSWDDTESQQHHLRIPSPTAACAASSPRGSGGRLPIQMLNLPKTRGERGRDSRLGKLYNRGVVSHSPNSSHKCCSRGSMGKVLLSFVAGAWFALAVLSEYLGNVTSTFQSIISGAIFEEMPLLATRADTRIDKEEGVYYYDRTICVNKGLSFTRRPFRYTRNRSVEQYPADYSDVTQTYPEMDSNDIDSEDDYHGMEMRVFPRHESDPNCEPMAEWQTTYHPTCSMFHETDMAPAIQAEDLSLLSSKGNWRLAWELWDRPQSGWSKVVGGHEDTVVLKTFKYEHNYEDAFYEFNRVDAIAMERLTSSPYVMNIYGFCGMSAVTGYAGETVTDIVDSINPLGKLFMARLIAKGLADIHGIDGGGEDNVSLVHNDVNYANIMVGGPRRLPRFNDFNLAVLQMRNKETGKTCPFSHHFPNPQWRSYEEQVGPDGNTKQLNEKIDVYSLGNLFYRFIVGKGPWKHAPWRTEFERNSAGQLDPTKITKDDKLRIARMKREEGALPPIPDDMLTKIKGEPALYALYKVMEKTYKFDPAERPSAEDLVDYIDLQLDKLDPEKKGRKL